MADSTIKPPIKVMGALALTHTHTHTKELLKFQLNKFSICMYNVSTNHNVFAHYLIHPSTVSCIEVPHFSHLPPLLYAWYQYLMPPLLRSI